MAEKGALGEIFDRNIDRWRQSKSVIEAFTSRTLGSLQFTRQAMQLIKTCMNETADEWRLTARDKGFPSAKGDHLWPQPPLSSSSRDRRDCQKHS